MRLRMARKKYARKKNGNLHFECFDSFFQLSAYDHVLFKTRLCNYSTPIAFMKESTANNLEEKHEAKDDIFDRLLLCA
jgi:hypothetical protein